MQIDKLIIKQLYGYIDKHITFNNDLTLLVGINGSGKTSILNILNWVLRPSIPNLCVTEFKSIQLFFQFKNDKYEILCKHNKTTFTYTIKTEKEKYNPLIVRIGTPPFVSAESPARDSAFINEIPALIAQGFQPWPMCVPIVVFESPTCGRLSVTIEGDTFSFCHPEVARRRQK